MVWLILFEQLPTDETGSFLSLLLFRCQIRFFLHLVCGSTNPSRPCNSVGQPHSSWSDFASNSSGPGPAPTPSHGARPQMEKDAFSDLLNDFSESASWQTHSDSQGPAKSINQMRREQLAKTTDPEQLKVSFLFKLWTSGSCGRKGHSNATQRRWLQTWPDQT